MSSLPALSEAIVTRRAAHSPDKALLVGVSGIDASGKGYTSAQLVADLTTRGLNAVLINVDGWLNPPSIRFGPTDPGRLFYEHGIRLDEMFARLAVPLRDTRSVRVTMNWYDETATEPRPYTYDFVDVNVVVIEGVFLYKKAHRPHFDLAAWVDCSWDTALERAISRAQEGLPPDETVAAFRRIYFPAQEVHFALDEPRKTADLLVPNDPHLGERPPAGA